MHVAADPDSLICPDATIFDMVSFRAFLQDAHNTPTDTDFRSRCVADLRNRRKHGMTVIADALAQSPLKARQAVQSYAWLTDCIVSAVWHISSMILYTNPTPTEGEKLSVIAVGGYGRGEMAPASDVDLLFLTPYKITPWSESVIETMLYILWDLRLKVGHSSRTIRDCLRLGGEDFTIRTAMLEQRYVCGDTGLAQELEEELWSELFVGSAREFIDAKLGERDTRHEKQGQRYMVEPNVKEGKGGLRDLQSLFWITKYVYRVQNTAKLVDLGVFR